MSKDTIQLPSHHQHQRIPWTKTQNNNHQANPTISPVANTTLWCFNKPTKKTSRNVQVQNFSTQIFIVKPTNRGNKPQGIDAMQGVFQRIEDPPAQGLVTRGASSRKWSEKKNGGFWGEISGILLFMGTQKHCFFLLLRMGNGLKHHICQRQMGLRASHVSHQSYLFIRISWKETHGQKSLSFWCFTWVYVLVLLVCIYICIDKSQIHTVVRFWMMGWMNISVLILSF